MGRKRSLKMILTLSFVGMALLMTSCKKEAVQVIDLTYLVNGKWYQENRTTSPSDRIYWRYRANNNGVTWNESLNEDEYVGEDESNLTFTWSVEGNSLKHVFRGEMGNQGVTKYYTVVELDNNRMIWKDDYGDLISLVKR